MFTFLLYEESHIVSFLIFMPVLSIHEKSNSSLSKRTKVNTYLESNLVLTIETNNTLLGGRLLFPTKPRAGNTSGFTLLMIS